ncbi:MAG: peptidyl-prolyl cis-trans isomerase [Halothiobacillaceae bacterium]
MSVEFLLKGRFQMRLPLVVLMLVFASAMSSSAWAEEPKSDNPVVVTVDGEPLRLSDVRAYVDRNPMLRGHIGSAEGIRRVIEDMVNVRLFSLEGIRQDIQFDSDEDRLDNAEYAITVRGRLLEKCPVADDEELRAFFETHRADFATPTFVKVARVALPADLKGSEESSAREYLLAQAEAVMEDQISFDELVRSAEEMAPEVRHGEMSFVEADGSDELGQALEEAPLGSLIGPIEREGYVYLMKVLDRRDPVQMSWEEARSDVAQAYQQQCRQARFAELRQSIEEHFPVTYNEEVIAQIR